MIIDIILLFVICCLTFCIVYTSKMHYYEVKALYSKLGVQIESNQENKPSKVRNHIKKKMMEQQGQGGD